MNCRPGRPARTSAGVSRTPCGGTRAFDAVPWREELSIDNVEFDVAWRLVFGGITADMAEFIDHPDHGFAWRGERMEWAFAQALHDCLPPASVVTGEQPAPEIHPPGVVAFDTGDRADVDVLTLSGQRHVFDVRTVNVQCCSGLQRHSSAEAHCAAIEAEKRGHYGQRYRRVAPFVVTLSGAVTQASAVALGRVASEVARGDRTVLDWEPARRLDNMLHRIAVDMIYQDHDSSGDAGRAAAAPAGRRRAGHPLCACHVQCSDAQWRECLPVVGAGTPAACLSRDNPPSVEVRPLDDSWRTCSSFGACTPALTLGTRQTPRWTSCVLRCALSGACAPTRPQRCAGSWRCP